MNDIVILAFFAITFIMQGCRKSPSAINHINCEGLTTDTLGTSDTASIYMPSAFTPNEDGLNDLCIAITKNISSIDFTLYDENDNIVFETTKLGQGWTAAPSPARYKIYYFKIQGLTTSGHKIGLCGQVYALTCCPPTQPENKFHFQDQLSDNGFTLPTYEKIATCQ